MAYNNIDINLKANVESTSRESLKLPVKSIKSMRTYQVGIVYKDKHGRETPVFTNEKASFTLPKRLCNQENGIVASVLNDAPDWADSYKFFIKETSNEYYNICMDRWYESADGNVWLSFPSAERNKIKEDDYIILKKRPGETGTAVVEDSRYRIIDIKNEAPEFIKTDFEIIGIDTIRLTVDGAMPKSKTIKFQGPTSVTNGWKNSVFYDDQKDEAGGNQHGFVTGSNFSDIAVRIQDASDKTNFLDVASIVSDGNNFVCKLSKSIPGEKLDGKPVTISGINSIVQPNSTFSGQDADQDITFAFAKKVVKNRSEFEGRFFVKIKRDEALNSNIVQTAFSQIKPNVVNSMPCGYVNLTSPSWSSNTDAINYWKTFNRNQLYIDEINRFYKSDEDHRLHKGDRGFGIRGDQGGSGNYANGGPRQAYSKSHLRCSMELSLSTLNNNKEDGFGFTNDTPPNVKDFYEKMRTSGTYFRFREDPYQMIYRVNVETETSNDNKNHGRGLFNYALTERNKRRNKTNRIYVRCVASGWRLENDQGFYEHAGTTRTTHGSNIASGNTAITLSSANANILPGMTVSGQGIDADTIVISISGTALVISKASVAQTDAGATLTFSTFKKYIFDANIEGKYPWNYRNKVIGSTVTAATGINYDPNQVAKIGYALKTSIETADAGSTSSIIDPGPWDPTKKGYGKYGDTSATGNLYDLSNNTYKSIEQTGSGGYANSSGDGSDINYNTAGGRFYNHIDIVELSPPDDAEIEYDPNPAIWETEPKEAIDLDIYYEASQAYPTKLTNKTNELLIPYGSKVECVDTVEVTSGSDQGNKRLYLPENTYVEDWAPIGHGGDTLLLNIEPSQIGYIDVDKKVSNTVTVGGTVFNNDTFEFFDTQNSNGNPRLPLNGASANLDVFSYINNYFTDQVITGVNSTRGKSINLKFIRPDKSTITLPVQYFSVWRSNDNFVDGFKFKPLAVQNTGYYVLIKLKNDLSKNINIKLPYFNCYSFGNGVESDRIRDDFNAVRLDKGVKASSVIAEPYIEEQRTNGLIYSGIYNSNSSKNDLNQFIAGESITKDINPTYGSIQKLYQKDPFLITFCEDKVLKITANKDTLFNAGGNAQLVSSNRVLGDASTYQGEYGISKNPESFAFESFRTYFTDKQRGKVLRLSGDGITEISNAGMRYYFEQNLKTAEELIGTFDDRKQEYNLTIKQSGKASSSAQGLLYLNSTTISFSEFAKGWVSFKSFIPEHGLSMNNDYYTFKRGELYKHHSNNTRNNFYNQQFDSHVDIIFNQSSESVKNFRSMKYEGSQSRITEVLDDNKYFNNEGKQGWYVESGNTDLENIGEMEFKNKEGKWFSSIKGVEVGGVSGLNSKEFSFQGIDVSKSVNIISEPPPPGVEILGCTDPSAKNYNPNATTDDGSCEYKPVISGCMNPEAVNYNPEATIDDGSCIIAPIVYGCTNPKAINYNPNATDDDGTCQLALTYGCTDPEAMNYDPTVDIDDGSCIYDVGGKEVPGCTDPAASNYDPNATIDNGSCEYNSSTGCDANYYPIVTRIDFNRSNNYMNSNMPGVVVTDGGPAPYGDGMSTIFFKIKVPNFDVANDAYIWSITYAAGGSNTWTDSNIYLGKDFQIANPTLTIPSAYNKIVLTDGGYTNNGDSFQFFPFPLPQQLVQLGLSYNQFALTTCISHQTAVAPHNAFNTVAGSYSNTNRTYVESDDSNGVLSGANQILWSGDYTLSVTHYSDFLKSNLTECVYTENFTIGNASVDNKISANNFTLNVFYNDPTMTQVDPSVVDKGDNGDEEARPQITTDTSNQDPIYLDLFSKNLEKFTDITTNYNQE